MRNLIVLLFICFILTGCEEKEPVTEEKMILIYSDLMFAQDTVLINKDNVDSLKSVVFDRHNISENDYIKTLDIYNEKPERWEKFFERVIEYVESLKTGPPES